MSVCKGGWLYSPSFFCLWYALLENLTVNQEQITMGMIIEQCIAPIIP